MIPLVTEIRTISVEEPTAVPSFIKMEHILGTDGYEINSKGDFILSTANVLVLRIVSPNKYALRIISYTPLMHIRKAVSFVVLPTVRYMTYKHVC